MARYSITEDVSFEEATPRGLLSVAFKAGEVDAEPGSDEQYAIEYVLIPMGVAAPVADAPPAAPKTKRKPKAAPVTEPAAPAAPADPPAAPAAAPDFIPAS